MSKLTYNTKLICDPESKVKIMQILEIERDAWNLCSKLCFNELVFLNIKTVHDKSYHAIKSKFPNIKSQLIIKAEQGVLACLKTIKSNKHKPKSAPIKKRLSLQLDKRLYVLRDNSISITTLEKRVKCSWSKYTRLDQLFTKGYKVCDPKLFVRDGEIYISFTFDLPEVQVNPTLALGVDLGYRRYAATSEGKIFIDREYNARKRKLRYLKRCLNSKKLKSKTARKHLAKIRCKEQNMSKDFNHNLANQILKTKANVIALENLNVRDMKKRKHKGKSKSKKGQVSLSELRRLFTYKAALLKKVVVCVNPKYTSQRDCLTGKRLGERKGCRFYSVSGLIYDSDVNAAINIAKLTKLPVSQGFLLDGQAVVNRPYV